MKYDYFCRACNTEVEIDHPIILDGLKIECPNCGNSDRDKLDKLISGSVFLLKGDNWSKDSYGIRKPK